MSKTAKIFITTLCLLLLVENSWSQSTKPKKNASIKFPKELKLNRKELNKMTQHDLFLRAFQWLKSQETVSGKSREELKKTAFSWLKKMLKYKSKFARTTTKNSTREKIKNDPLWKQNSLELFNQLKPDGSNSKNKSKEKVSKPSELGDLVIKFSAEEDKKNRLDLSSIVFSSDKSKFAYFPHNDK